VSVGAGLTWSPALAVGVAELDTQHQELFRRAERLIAALRAGDRGEVLPLLAYLDDYVVRHFAAEERLMEKVGFPGRVAHAAAHAAFRADFAALVKDFRRTGPTALVALTIHNWLSDWLRMHIGGVDQELGRWIAAHPATDPGAGSGPVAGS
jgi:hemerythrin